MITVISIYSLTFLSLLSYDQVLLLLYGTTLHGVLL
jgi:hypothetical protein